MRLIVFLFIMCPFLCCAQHQNYSSKVLFAMETYAFLKGQSAALQKIADQFPSLASDITTAKIKMDALYGPAENNIKLFLKEELDQTQYSTFLNQLDSLLSQQLKDPIEEENYARIFIKNVIENTGTFSDTDLAKGILAFKYHNMPHQEVIDGHTDDISLANHPKAGVVSIKLKVPSSWTAEEAAMPQTIQQFTSCNGNGSEKILLVVYDLPTDFYDISINESSISNFLPPQTRLIRSEAATIEKLPAFMVEAEEIISSYKNEYQKVRMMQFMVIRNKKLYCIQCSIGPAAVKENLAPQLKKYEPLFKLIAARTKLDD